MATKVERKPFTTERQRELMRVIQECFDKFAQRNQSYYQLDGMTTAHVTVHAIADFTTLRAFWPQRLVEYRGIGGAIYHLEDGTMSDVQSAVRSTLEQLQAKGYIERLGNEHERRWRPIPEEEKPKKTKVFDAAGKHIGWTQAVDGEVKFTPVSG